MRKLLPFMLILLLVACASKEDPFGKTEDSKLVSPITAPPWEALVAAGPGAAQDIDLETLNGPGMVPPDAPIAEAPVTQAAEAVPEKPKSKGTEINAVAVVQVKGASGAGNDELTNAMRQTLTKAGWKVLKASSRNALTIAGVVTMAPGEGATQTVGLTWEVKTPDGKSLGDIKQSNSVPKGSLDAGWGENAGFATEAAATGIYELINKYR